MGSPVRQRGREDEKGDMGCRRVQAREGAKRREKVGKKVENKVKERIVWNLGSVWAGK